MFIDMLFVKTVFCGGSRLPSWPLVGKAPGIRHSAEEVAARPSLSGAAGNGSAHWVSPLFRPATSFLGTSITALRRGLCCYRIAMVQNPWGNDPTMACQPCADPHPFGDVVHADL